MAKFTQASGFKLPQKYSNTSAKFAGKNITSFAAGKCLPYLPWPPWARQHKEK